jgi:predicted ATPase
MIESVQFRNFKALRDATLPLAPLTVIVGPNGSGKSTVLEAFRLMRDGLHQNIAKKILSVHRSPGDDALAIKVTFSGCQTPLQWTASPKDNGEFKAIPDAKVGEELKKRIQSVKEFEFVANDIAAPVVLSTKPTLEKTGKGLAGVLDSFRDADPERFNAIRIQLREWLPEYDEIQFEVPAEGKKAIWLRTTVGGHRIPAANLSYGTLVALALLTLAYLPEAPPLVLLEEPDRGIHPRLLRQLKDALYRLSYPESFGETRAPVQVIATTHSPYFVDQFKEHPEEVVIANKQNLDVTFERLSNEPHMLEIIQDASLGEAWYSGILGGVPATP